MWYNALRIRIWSCNMRSQKEMRNPTAMQSPTGPRPSPTGELQFFQSRPNSPILQPVECDPACRDLHMLNAHRSDEQKRKANPISTANSQKPTAILQNKPNSHVPPASHRLAHPHIACESRGDANLRMLLWHRIVPEEQ